MGNTNEKVTVPGKLPVFYRLVVAEADLKRLPFYTGLFDRDVFGEGLPSFVQRQGEAFRKKGFAELHPFLLSKA